MKKLAFLLIAGFGITSANAQKVQQKQVPVSVKAALQKEYPNVKMIKWEKEKDDYEAGFTDAHENYSVLINPAGNILETEIAIPVNALSEKIKLYIAKNYPGKKIAEAAKITDAKGTLSYEAEVNGVDLLFDSNGKFIKSKRD